METIHIEDTRPAAGPFDEAHVLHHLAHYLPAQAPLKDFVHHNTLHAFQDEPFFEAIRKGREIFGYKSSLTVEEFRALYSEGKITPAILEHVVERQVGAAEKDLWLQKLLVSEQPDPAFCRIGKVRQFWKQSYKLDLDSLVHPTLFRILCSFLDQGISIWDFPVKGLDFLSTMAEMERKSFVSFFREKRARKLLLADQRPGIRELLDLLVGDESLYEQYLFDQQFGHQGWSGMVATIEREPHTLLDRKNITLHDLIIFELLLEIDALDHFAGKDWKPLNYHMSERPKELFAEVPVSEYDRLVMLWQEALEWSLFDQVLKGVQTGTKPPRLIPKKSFQALFCIDDREGSYRRYLEMFDPNCETFGTPGFFAVETYYQPQDGQFYTKVCPGPVTPKHLIKEYQSTSKRATDVHFSKHSHSFHSGWLIAQTLGFWSALKLFINLFRPSMSPATASSFKHMDRYARLTIENRDPEDIENGLQIGYTIGEMADRVESVLKSIGLVKDFAPLIYVVGHGASSVNNPHYAAYDCGACSGRAGSVNARSFAYMANHTSVRQLLRERGLDIPSSTHFMGAIRDTTRDEITFFDEDALSLANQARHHEHEGIFVKASHHNAKERARRFESVDPAMPVEKVHEKVLRRSVSLFEPRPELNHATNALCLVGRREMSRGLFLDRRAFLNSYDYTIDPSGKYLAGILNAAVSVCGGINLEYYFSRVDNQKLGAGSKLPHNVMGLFGVANGIDGDLRPGLPSQMIEIHDPVRLMLVVEHFPEVVNAVIRQNPATYAWLKNDWVILTVVNPSTRQIYAFRNEDMVPYEPVTDQLDTLNNIFEVLETKRENLPIYLLKQ